MLEAVPAAIDLSRRGGGGGVGCGWAARRCRVAKGSCTMSRLNPLDPLFACALLGRRRALGWEPEPPGAGRRTDGKLLAKGGDAAPRGHPGRPASPSRPRSRRARPGAVLRLWATAGAPDDAPHARYLGRSCDKPRSAGAGRPQGERSVRGRGSPWQAPGGPVGRAPGSDYPRGIPGAGHRREYPAPADRQRPACRCCASVAGCWCRARRWRRWSPPRSPAGRKPHRRPMDRIDERCITADP